MVSRKTLSISTFEVISVSLKRKRRTLSFIKKKNPKKNFQKLIYRPLFLDDHCVTSPCKIEGWRRDWYGVLSISFSLQPILSYYPCKKTVIIDPAKGEIFLKEIGGAPLAGTNCLRYVLDVAILITKCLPYLPISS